ncbi:MAG: hypothetical protein E7379_00995 [Clostridiales bacterium]|nr:hypothetical protein [Clostridiales bacterium]
MDLEVVSKNKKRIIAMVFLLLGMLAIDGIACVFMLNYNTFLPSAPIILDDGKSILITTSINENYLGYRFRFMSTDEEDVLIESAANTLTDAQLEESGLILGKTYRVSVCYMGETEAAGTGYGESVSWVYSKVLDKPEISIDEINQVISWTEVENADYYVVHYKNGSSFVSQKYYSLSFDYSSWVGGDKEFYVVAHSNNSAYRCSQVSEKLKFQHKYRMLQVSSATFNSSNFYLSVVLQEQISYIEVDINGKSYVVKLPEYKYNYTSHLYQYEGINLKTVYKEGATIKVKPYPSNDHMSYKGDWFTVIINND